MGVGPISGHSCVSYQSRLRHNATISPRNADIATTLCKHRLSLASTIIVVDDTQKTHQHGAVEPSRLIGVVSCLSALCFGVSVVWYIALSTIYRFVTIRVSGDADI